MDRNTKRAASSDSAHPKKGKKKQKSGSSSESPDEGGPQLIRAACDKCRSRKRKCDFSQPMCGPCEKLGQPCTYSRLFSRRGPRAGEIKQLKRRVKELEEKLQAAETLARGMQTNPYAISSGPYNGSSGLNPISGRSSASYSGSGGNSPSGRTSRGILSRSHGPLPMSISQVIASNSALLSKNPTVSRGIDLMLDMYFRGVNHLFPLVNETEFRTRAAIYPPPLLNNTSYLSTSNEMYTPSSVGTVDRIWAMIYYGVLAIGAALRFEDFLSRTMGHFSEQIGTDLLNDASRGVVTLPPEPMCRSLLLLSWYGVSRQRMRVTKVFLNQCKSYITEGAASGRPLSRTSTVVHGFLTNRFFYRYSIAEQFPYGDDSPEEKSGSPFFRGSGSGSGSSSPGSHSGRARGPNAESGFGPSQSPTGSDQRGSVGNSHPRRSHSDGSTPPSPIEAGGLFLSEESDLHDACLGFLETSAKYVNSAAFSTIDAFEFVQKLDSLPALNFPHNLASYFKAFTIKTVYEDNVDLVNASACEATKNSLEPDVPVAVCPFMSLLVLDVALTHLSFHQRDYFRINHNLLKAAASRWEFANTSLAILTVHLKKLAEPNPAAPEMFFTDPYALEFGVSHGDSVNMAVPQGTLFDTPGSLLILRSDEHVAREIAEERVNPFLQRSTFLANTPRHHGEQLLLPQTLSNHESSMSNASQNVNRNPPMFANNQPQQVHVQYQYQAQEVNTSQHFSSQTGHQQLQSRRHEQVQQHRMNQFQGLTNQAPSSQISSAFSFDAPPSSSGDTSGFNNTMGSSSSFVGDGGQIQSGSSGVWPKNSYTSPAMFSNNNSTNQPQYHISEQISSEEGTSSLLTPQQLQEQFTSIHQQGLPQGASFSTSEMRDGSRF